MGIGRDYQYILRLIKARVNGENIRDQSNAVCTYGEGNRFLFIGLEFEVVLVTMR